MLPRLTSKVCSMPSKPVRNAAAVISSSRKATNLLRLANDGGASDAGSDTTAGLLLDIITPCLLLEFHLATGAAFNHQYRFRLRLIRPRQGWRHIAAAYHPARIVRLVQGCADRQRQP